MTAIYFAGGFDTMNEHEIKNADGNVVGTIFCLKVDWTETGECEHNRVLFSPRIEGELRLPTGWRVERVK